MPERRGVYAIPLLQGLSRTRSKFERIPREGKIVFPSGLLGSLQEEGEVLVLNDCWMYVQQ